MGKERRLVREQMVMHLVKPVDFRKPEIAAEQVRHRAALIPLAMKAPLPRAAARALRAALRAGYLAPLGSLPGAMSR